MTQPPDWWSQLTPGIHNAPPRVPAPDPVAFTWQQLQQIVSGLVNEFLRQVAVALGAIEIFGFKPYEALVEIGENIAAAKANFDAMFAGLLVGDIPGVLGYFGNLGVTGLYNAAAGFGNLSTSLLKNLTPTGGNIGQFDASALTGALNTALTFSGTALSTLLQYLNSAGQFSAAQLTGALNGAVTFGGTALSTVLQYLNSSGQFSAAQLTGALNGAVTLGGTTLSTLVTNINSSGQLLASGITGALGTGLTVGGVTLGTLFTNINSSGQLVLSGATGALNTAVTLGGTALSTLSTNWNAAVTNVNSLISGVTGASTAADVATNINLAATNIAQIGTAAQNAAAGVVGSLNTAATQVQTAFSGILTGILGGLTGAPAPAAPTLANANTALAGVTTNAVGNATAMMALQAQQAGRAGLLSVKFNFADYGTASLPASFTVSNDTTVVSVPTGGGLTIVNGRVVYQQSGGSGGAWKMARYNVAPTTTDYQEVSWVWTDEQAVSGGRNTIYLRVNSAATSFLKFHAQSGDLAVTAVVAGVQTFIGLMSPPDGFIQGAKYTLRAGSLANLYTIYLYENDTLCGSITDSTVHQVGASYRYAAFGLYGDNTGTTMKVYAVNSFSVADQVFAPGPPAAAYVSTLEGRSSATYGDLPTTTDTVTVIIGSSGSAQVTISAWGVYSVDLYAVMSFAVSGANTISASDAMSAVGYFNVGLYCNLNGTFLLTGLTPGSTTFKLKYRSGSASATRFQFRRISVIPL